MNLFDKIQPYLKEVYENETLREAEKEFRTLIENAEKQTFQKNEPLNHKNVYLITYGDSFYEKDKAPLTVLHEVVDETLQDTVSDIHLLPMFPYTSDDGFSVTDYLTINPDLGDWNNIENLSQDYRLMFDFVANHLSKSSDWFQKFLDDQPDFKSAFVEEEVDFDTSNVIRPRVSPLFHDYQNSDGKIKRVWSTFSEDQVDVNPKDPKMLARLTAVLLEYAKRGATSIRLDAIGFLWKESGTTCMHLPQTHAIIQMWRVLLDELSPNMQIITETNVPHIDNISYFGNGNNEANQVYQFPLPPLVLHTFVTQNSEKLRNWASEIDVVSDTATFFNFLASHDGIGLRPTEGILTDDEREQLVQRVLENGGRVSYKNNPDGSQSVYEMNINYSEALKDNEQPEWTTAKMIAAHHILLSLVGVPAIYYHSIFGSKNDQEGVESSGINRRINREKLEKTTLLKELDTDGYRKTIYTGITDLIRIRQQEAAFNPYAPQKVIDFGNEVFAVRRFADDHSSILALTNVTAHEVELQNIKGLNLIHQQDVTDTIKLAPYETAWIKEEQNV